MRRPPKSVMARFTFRFPFRSLEDNIYTLKNKYGKVADAMNPLEGVDDVYYEEDEKWGLFIELEVSHHSPAFTGKTVEQLHEGIAGILRKLYNIDECY